MGHLVLTRPVFRNNTCSACDKPWGSGCWCYGTDPSFCVGCLCKTDKSAGNFYCDDTGVDPPPPPTPPPTPTRPCEDFSGDWHFGTQYRAHIAQDNDCKLTVTANDPYPPCGAAGDEPPCRVSITKCSYRSIAESLFPKEKRKRGTLIPPPLPNCSRVVTLKYPLLHVQFSLLPHSKTLSLLL
jgi:hypothetical protein